MKTTFNKIRIYQFNLPSDITSFSIGKDVTILKSPYSYDSVLYLKFFAYVFEQYRDIDNLFEQIAVTYNKDVIGVNLKRTFSEVYNGATAYALIYVK